MISARPGGLPLLAAALAALTAAGCNEVFGIREGQPEGGGGAGGGGAGGGGAGGGGGGAGGGAVCPPEKPTSCEAAFLSDPSSCCTAGRSCQGGPCVEGVCLSALHGQSAEGNEAIDIVRTGDLVLWTGGWERAIYRSDTDGGGFAPLLGGAQHDFNYVTMLAADSDPSGYAFFTDYAGARIGRVALETGVYQELAQVPGSAVLDAEARWGRILVHGDHVYWALDFQATDGMGTQVGKHIWRAPREPAAPPVVAEQVVETTGAFGLAADDDHLYFGKSETGTVERLAFAEIGKLDGNGAPVLGEPEVLAQGQGAIGDIAVDGDNVYWAKNNEVRYQRKSVQNGTITTVFGLDSYVWGIVSDGRDIYISTVGDGDTVQGAVWRAPVDLSVAPELLYRTEGDAAGDWKSAYSIAEDCDTVYFLVQQGGLVRRLTK